MEKNTWQRGQEAGAYVPQYLYKGAIGTKTVQVQLYQLSIHQLCLTCYCYFFDMRKMTIFLAT